MRTYEDDITDMRLELRELRNRVAVLDESLRDYYRERLKLQTEIIHTFPHQEVEHNTGPQHCVKSYTRDGIIQRAELFVECDRLNVVYSPVVKERREKAIEARGIEKIIERITERIQKKPQRVFEFAMEE